MESQEFQINFQYSAAHLKIFKNWSVIRNRFNAVVRETRTTALSRVKTLQSVLKDS